MVFTIDELVWFADNPGREKLFNVIKSSLTLIASAALIAGCGGGGGDSGSSATTTTNYPLQAGYKARISAGANDNFSITGTCAGTATITTSSSSASTFETIAGFSAAQTITINLTNCVPATNAVSGTSYFDTNYTPLGSSVPGTEYVKFATLPPAIPASVKVGDTAVYATFNTYTDSAKATATGQRLLSYVIEADTSNTVIANLITKGYNSATQLLFTQQSRYRVAADGTLTIISIDVQYSTTSTNHILFTKT